MGKKDNSGKEPGGGGDRDRRESGISRRFFNLKGRKLGTTFAELRNTAYPQARIEDLHSLHLQIGAIVGGAYKIISLIGQGGMGEVYLAEHQTLNKRCALKLIAPEQVTELSWKRFQQEAKAIANLEHVNLVKVTDLGIHKGYLPFYAMEFVDGETLEDLIADKGSMPLATVLEIFMQICDGVDYAHRAGIIHRDIKPANIMVIDNGGKLAVKILDFGLAKLTTKDREVQSLTMVGDVFGSPYYMSPEQCDGAKVDNRSDIYSIGCALFECLTGRPPFVGNVASAIIFCHQESEPPPLSSIIGPKKLPESIEIVVAKALRKRPTERYQSCRELSADLKRVSRNEDVLPVYVSRSGADRSASNLTGVGSGTDIGSGTGSQGMANVLSPRSKTFGPGSASAATTDFRSFFIIGGLISLALVVGLGWYFLNLKPRGPAIPSAVQGAGRDIGFDGAVTFKATEEAVDSSAFSGFRLSQASDRHYSQLVTISNQKFLSFDFPSKFSLGRLTDGKKSYLATGNVVFAVPTNIIFEPSDLISQHPEYLKLFQPGDLTGIDLSRVADLDAGVAALTKLPGYKDLKYLRFGSILEDRKTTMTTWDILNSFKAPSTFILQGSVMPANEVGRFAWLSRVKEVELIGVVDGSSILPSLRDSCNLRRLKLACDLDNQDLERIASLPSLENLEIVSGISTIGKLRRLHTAPMLRNLSLPSPILGDPSLGQVLSTFPHLRKVCFSDLNPIRSAQAKLLKVPYVEVVYTESATSK